MCNLSQEDQISVSTLKGVTKSSLRPWICNTKPSPTMSPTGQGSRAGTRTHDNAPSSPMATTLKKDQDGSDTKPLRIKAATTDTDGAHQPVETKSLCCLNLGSKEQSSPPYRQRKQDSDITETLKGPSVAQ